MLNSTTGVIDPKERPLPHADLAGKASRIVPSFHLGHRAYLDGFRGVAVLLVLAHHARLVTPLGVDIFFVLSGFLITVLLIQEWERTERIALGKFYARRALRLFPALVLLLAGVWLHALVFQDWSAAEKTGKASLIALFYLSNWAEAFGLFPLGVLYHTWSLSVEEQFYLCWPLIMLLLLKLRFRWPHVLALLVVGVAAIIVQRIYLAQAGTSYVRLYVALDTRGDALLIGCALGVVVARRLLPEGGPFHAFSRVLAAAGVVALGWLLRTDLHTPWGVVLSATLAPLAAAAVLLSLTAAPTKAALWFLEWPALVWVGRISYGLYLWNLPMCFIIYRPTWPWALMASLQITATFIAAACSFYFWEQPFLRLKQRFIVR